MKLWMVLLFPLVMLWPPAWLLIPVIPIVLLIIKLQANSARKRAARDHELAMEEYRARRAAREWVESGINPGWRL